MADNASNNDTLIDELSNLIPTFGGWEYHIRCFAHILNLVVKVGYFLFLDLCSKTHRFIRQSYHNSAAN